MWTGADMVATARRLVRRVPATGADLLVDCLERSGVEYVFGIPGAKIDAVFDALVGAGPRLVVCRHEQNAAFMAAAAGRLTGRPGVVLVTSGPGTSNLATGLATATTEGDPVVAFAGAVPRADRLKRTHRSMDSVGLLRAVCKSTWEVDDVAALPKVVSNAYRAASTSPRGAVAVILPQDLLGDATTESPAGAPDVPRLGPAPPEAVDRAADAVRRARTPVALLGARTGDQVTAEAVRGLMARTGLPVVETFQAAGVVPRGELEERFLGRVGLFRNQPGDEALGQADLVLAVGYDHVEYDPGLWNPGPGAGPEIVHLDDCPAEIDNRYRPSVELRGDVAATVTALADRLDGLALARGAAARVARLRARLADLDTAPAESRPGRIHPLRIVRALREAVDDDTTVVCDVGSHYIWMARHFRTYRPRGLLFSNGRQTLGVALPWAVATALVRPGHKVVSVSGDGGFLFSAMELETAVRVGADLTHLVWRDGTYDMVAFQERLKYGRTSGVDFGPIDTVRFAESFGATGMRATCADELPAVLRRALDTPGPVVVDVPVDYGDNESLGAVLRLESFE